MYTKGDRIRASWLKVNPLTCLAGAMPKVGATAVEVTGVVRHIRTDNPDNPVLIRVYIDPDDGYTGPTVNLIGCVCGHPHVELHPEWIHEIAPAK